MAPAIESRLIHHIKYIADQVKRLNRRNALFMKIIGKRVFVYGSYFTS